MFEDLSLYIPLQKFAQPQPRGPDLNTHDSSLPDNAHLQVISYLVNWFLKKKKKTLKEKHFFINNQLSLFKIVVILYILYILNPHLPSNAICQDSLIRSRERKRYHISRFGAITYPTCFNQMLIYTMYLSPTSILRVHRCRQFNP